MFTSMFYRYRTPVILVLLTVPLVMWTTGCGEEEPEHGQEGHRAPSDSPTTKPSSENSVKLSDDYPLTTCVVSGDPLDVMGSPFVIQHEGREVRFCCRACVTQFKEDPPKYLAMLDQATRSDHKAETNGLNHQEAVDPHNHADHNH